MTGFGQKRPFIGATRNGRLRMRKRSFERIAAAQNGLFVSYVGFGISKRKQMVGADFVT